MAAPGGVGERSEFLFPRLPIRFHSDERCVEDVAVVSLGGFELKFFVIVLLRMILTIVVKFVRYRTSFKLFSIDRLWGSYDIILKLVQIFEVRNQIRKQSIG